MVCTTRGTVNLNNIVATIIAIAVDGIPLADTTQPSPFDTTWKKPPMEESAEEKSGRALSINKSIGASRTLTNDIIRFITAESNFAIKGPSPQFYHHLGQ